MLAPSTLTRRKILTHAAAAAGTLVAAPAAWAAPQTMQEAPATAANQSRTFLHQEVRFSARPARLYQILLSSKEFAAVTGMSATIDPAPGGAFTTFGGLVVGRNVELIPSQRIVQAWRPTHWDDGVYSIVHFELKPDAAGTLLILDHTGFPQGEFDHLDSGWPPRYWYPLKRYLAM